MQADCRLRWLMVGDGFCLQSMTSSHNARFGTEKDQAKKELGVRTTCAARRANLAKRVECGQLAGAFGPPTALESGSKLHALQALREVRLRLCRAVKSVVAATTANEEPPLILPPPLLAWFPPVGSYRPSRIWQRLLNQDLHLPVRRAAGRRLGIALANSAEDAGDVAHRLMLAIGSTRLVEF